MLKRSAWIAALLIMMGSANAADLVVQYGNLCISQSQSQILLLDEVELEATVLHHRNEATAARKSESVILNDSQEFTWALAAELQCNVALGYFKGGHIDDVSTQKCDCFYKRMVSFR